MNHVYALSEVVGTSDKSIEDAIDQAINVAGQSIRNLDWFQVLGDARPYQGRPRRALPGRAEARLPLRGQAGLTPALARHPQPRTDWTFDDSSTFAPIAGHWPGGGNSSPQRSAPVRRGPTTAAASR